MTVTVYVGTSLDGFIARPDGGIDFLLDDPPGPAEDFGFAAFFATVDALVMGRASFEKVLEFPEWPYGDKRVVVLTHRPLDLAPARARGGRVETMEGAPADIVARLTSQGARHLYVDGGATAQAFLRDGQVDRIVLTRLPRLIGVGIPIFGPLRADVRLRHVQTRSWPNGFVQSEYEVLRPRDEAPPS